MMNHTDIRTISQKLLASDTSSHGWDHAERVWNLCRHIGSAEGADLEVLRLAAYLHDIGRPEEKSSGGQVCHAVAGAQHARSILQENGYHAKTIEQVVHCIASHRFRRNGERPGTLEARVLFDADKLDAIGAVGIGRAFLFAGEVGARLHNPEADILNTRAYSPDDTAFREFSVKLKDIKDRMLTMTGKRIAEDRHRFMVDYFDRLTQEVHGEK
jgi:uncharacterized protein